MNETVYDQHADFYVRFLDHVIETPSHRIGIDELLAEAGPLEGLAVCDLACGEGFLSRLLADRGARVRGFDASERLITLARERSGSGCRFDVADAQSLSDVPDDSFDVVFCYMAAMDIADINALFRTVARILRLHGRFFLTLLHPCFETPFDADTGPIVEADAAGRFVACRVMRYRNEGHWRSGGVGVRGHMGAYHRTLSTYINTLIATGHRIARMLEHMMPIDDYDDLGDQWEMNIPRKLTVCTTVA